MSSSSSSLPVSSSRRTGNGEENNDNPSLTGLLLRFRQLEERIIAETTISTCHTTPLRNVPSISDIVGCDITINDIQSTKEELTKFGVDLKKDVNVILIGSLTPMILFCWVGNLLVIKVLFLIGANCTQLCINDYRFPMLAAAEEGYLDICKWLFEYGGDAKYQINREATGGRTPLQKSYDAWYQGSDKEGKTCRWLLRNGGGQHFSSKAMHHFLEIKGTEEIQSNLLVMWMRENIQFHDTFILLLCGAATMIATSSSQSYRRSRRCKRPLHHQRPLQILHGHPGIMELIGDCVGLIRGKELRMLKEFNELVIG